MRQPVAIHTYEAGQISAALVFLKRTRTELRELRKVRVWNDKVQVVDVNKDSFEIRQIGYADPEVTQLLDAVNTVYNPATIDQPIAGEEYKEFSAGRRYAWARDRVM